MQIERDGLRIWQMRPCVPGRASATRTCVENAGPEGEKIRIQSTVREFPNPITGRSFRQVRQEVRVLRPDGTLVQVTASGDGGKSPLTAEQMTGIALDPAVALAPPRTGP